MPIVGGLDIHRYSPAVDSPALPASVGDRTGRLARTQYRVSSLGVPLEVFRAAVRQSGGHSRP